MSSKSLLRKDKLGPEMKTLRDFLHGSPLSGMDAKVNIELHPGVYPPLDMQQLSANNTQLRSPKDDIAVSALVEVCSVYSDGERPPPEALLAAGTLAVGREPCKSYPSWATVSPWRIFASDLPSHLIVHRISRGHSNITWDSEVGHPSGIPLSVGQVVKLFPNRACVAASFYNSYFVVDSEHDRDGAKIIDVWMRANERLQ